MNHRTIEQLFTWYCLPSIKFSIPVVYASVIIVLAGCEIKQIQMTEKDCVKGKKNPSCPSKIGTPHAINEWYSLHYKM